MSADARHKINTELEYLRAFAVLGVIFFHLPGMFPWQFTFFDSLAKYFATGTVGVQLFFVISGYIVSKSAYETIDRPNDHGYGTALSAAQAFWTRRIFRLWPSSWLWVTAFFLMTIYFNSAGLMGASDAAFKAIVGVVTNTFNFLLLADPRVGTIGIYWTLAIEEQFYFLFPLFVMLVPARWQLPMVLTAATLQAIPPLSDAMSLLVRTDCLLWGVALYLLSKKPWFASFEPTFLRNPILAAASTVGLLALAAAIEPGLNPMSVRYGVSGLVCVLIVFIATFDRGYIYMPRTLRPIFRWTGSRSYALYLIHPLAMYATAEIWHRLTGGAMKPNYTFRLLVTALVLTPLLAEISYRLVEMPLRKKGRTIAGRMQSRRVEDQASQ